MKRFDLDNAYNQYNFEARNRKAFEVGSDVETLKKKFHSHRPMIASSSYVMFWVSVAITLSFVISQLYLMLSR